MIDSLQNLLNKSYVEQRKDIYIIVIELFFFWVLNYIKLDIYRFHDLKEFYLNELWEIYKENESL